MQIYRGVGGGDCGSRDGAMYCAIGSDGDHQAITEVLEVVAE